jgi:membrane protein insertase Oxa1/YidC/SpoIIIJ
MYFLPIMIFLFTVNIPSALSLYWLTSGIVAFIQQSIILNRDEDEMEAIADKPKGRDVASIPEAQVVEQAAARKAEKARKTKAKTKKRRKK